MTHIGLHSFTVSLIFPVSLIGAVDKATSALKPSHLQCSAVRLQYDFLRTLQSVHWSIMGEASGAEFPGIESERRTHFNASTLLVGRAYGMEKGIYNHF